MYVYDVENESYIYYTSLHNMDFKLSKIIEKSWTFII